MAKKTTMSHKILFTGLLLVIIIMALLIASNANKIKEIVVSKNGVFAATNVMKVTLSCDHRSVDGAVGAAFLQTLKKFIENPVTMLV